MPVETISGQSNLSVNAGKLVSLSHRHLSAAVRFSCAVGKIEREHQGQSGGEFLEDIFHFSTACMLTAAASLEACANELFFERETAFPDYSSVIR
jgi:hypothetical protein